MSSKTSLLIPIFCVRRSRLFHRCVHPPSLHPRIVVATSCLLASPCGAGGVHSLIIFLPDRRSLPLQLPTLFGRPVGTPCPPHFGGLYPSAFCGLTTDLPQARFMPPTPPVGRQTGATSILLSSRCLLSMCFFALFFFDFRNFLCRSSV